MLNLLWAITLPSNKLLKREINNGNIGSRLRIYFSNRSQFKKQDLWVGAIILHKNIQRGSCISHSNNQYHSWTYANQVRDHRHDQELCAYYTYIMYEMQMSYKNSKFDMKKVWANIISKK